MIHAVHLEHSALSGDTVAHRRLAEAGSAVPGMMSVSARLVAGNAGRTRNATRAAFVNVRISHATVHAVLRQRSAMTESVI